MGQGWSYSLSTMNKFIPRRGTIKAIFYYQYKTLCGLRKKRPRHSHLPRSKEASVTIQRILRDCFNNRANVT